METSSRSSLSSGSLRMPQHVAQIFSRRRQKMAQKMMTAVQAEMPMMLSVLTRGSPAVFRILPC